MIDLIYSSYASRQAPLATHTPQETQSGTNTFFVRLLGENGLYSGGDGMGQTVYAEYTKNSTPEDPIVHISGHALSGDYEKTVHLNDIDPTYATYPELCVLLAHKAKLGEYQPHQGFIMGTTLGVEPGDYAMPQNFLRALENDVMQCQRLGNAIEVSRGQAILNVYRQAAHAQTASIQTADDSPYSAVSWSDFIAGAGGSFVVPNSREDFEVMKAWFTDYLQQNPGLSFDDYEPLPDPSAVLTADNWKAMAQKYTPTSMTQQEYDNFLEELCQLGVLPTSYLPDLGHSASAANVTKITAGSLRPQLANAAEQPMTHAPTFQDGASRVNLFDWAQEEKAWQYFDEGKNQWLPTHKAVAFQQIYDILQKMALYR